ncbi:MAG: preprotein translocase subunit YajC [Flavobacteriales bacterium]|nr:preprotein translocase subunit YajC [Flavobacteriales bacterium]
MKFDLTLLQEAAAGGGEQAPGGFGVNNLIMFGLIALVFYLFMIRPQMKRTKEAKAFRAGLAQGDKVVTVGGIHGKILEVTETTVLISSEGSKFRVDKNSVSASAEEQLANKK